MLSPLPARAANLAKSHIEMSPQQISNHACLLAGVIYSMIDHIQTLEGALGVQKVLSAHLASSIIQIHDLQSMGLASLSKSMLLDAAEVCAKLTPDLVERVDLSEIERIVDAWPNWPEPEGKS